MNQTAAAAVAANASDRDRDGETLQCFLKEHHEEVCQDLAQERVGDLLEWLKTREVLNAVECEMIISSGPPQYQADTLLKILSARDAREHWIPLWNGIGKCSAAMYAKWHGIIGGKLGEFGLSGEQLVEQWKIYYSSMNWHVRKCHRNNKIIQYMIVPVHVNLPPKHAI